MKLLLKYIRSFFYILLFFFICTLIHADILWPFKEKSHLTGSFAEFRKSHIHAGIDISTKGKIGLPVYAGASGTLFRLKTQYLGFGKAIYIKLNDGKFLVYAHLKDFSPKIDDIVEKYQKKKGDYAIDLYLKDIVKIKKGELIGYSGDTGGVPPHLHMELRDEFERPINIVAHGLKIIDNTNPIITGLALCNPKDGSVISYYDGGTIPKEVQIPKGSALAVGVYDPSNGNRLGIYKLDLFIDGKPLFRIQTDSFSYNNFRDNFLVWNKDLYVNKNRIFYNLFLLPGNGLPFYPSNSLGFISLSPGIHKIKIVAVDFSGNKAGLSFNAKGSTAPAPQRLPVQKGIWKSKDNKCSVVIEKKDLYYPFSIDIDVLPKPGNIGELVPVSQIYNVKPKSAVFKEASVSIKGMEKTKVGLYRYSGNKWKYMDDNLTRDFGKFILFKDITPPKIKVISTYPVFRALITDNGSGLDYDSLSLYIDGKKVISEYSVNKKELFYKMPEGKHKIECSAKDEMGNSTSIED